MMSGKGLSSRRPPRLEPVYNAEFVEASLTLIKKTLLAGTGIILSGSLLWLSAQDRPTFRVKVDMVVLSFTVTDSKGKYINGLKPADFKVTEDGILQKINTFGEGSRPPLQVMEDGTTRALNPGPVDGTGVDGDSKSENRTPSFV